MNRFARVGRRCPVRIDEMRPVALFTAFACILASFSTSLLGETGNVPGGSLVAWLIHVDVQHLVIDLLAWLIFGWWLEPRIGSVRLGAWIAAGLSVSICAHALLYPHHGVLYGLSAVAFFVFAAGLAAGPGGLSVRCTACGLAVLAFVLAHELATGGVTPSRALLGGEALGERWRLLPVRSGQVGPQPVPLVHVVCAVAGAGFGLLARMRRSSRTHSLVALIPHPR